MVRFTDEFIFKIENFNERRQNAKAGEQIAESFYTSRRYRLETWVSLKGPTEDASHHVSIFTRTIKGSFDDVVQWPLKANVEFSVLSKNKKRFTRKLYTTNQADQQAFQKPLTNHGHSARGYGNFVPDDKVLSLVENDTFSICVKVTFNF